MLELIHKRWLFDRPARAWCLAGLSMLVDLQFLSRNLGSLASFYSFPFYVSSKHRSMFPVHHSEFSVLMNVMTRATVLLLRAIIT